MCRQRVVQHVADRCLEIAVRVDHLEMDWNFLQLVGDSVPLLDRHRSAFDIIMHEVPAFQTLTMENEMDMIVHQDESENNDGVTACDEIDPVHPIDEVFFIHEDPIDGIAVSGEVPAVPDADVLAADERLVKSKVLPDLETKFFM